MRVRVRVRVRMCVREYCQRTPFGAGPEQQSGNVRGRGWELPSHWQKGDPEPALPPGDGSEAVSFGLGGSRVSLRFRLD